MFQSPGDRQSVISPCSEVLELKFVVCVAYYCRCSLQCKLVLLLMMLFLFDVLFFVMASLLFLLFLFLFKFVVAVLCFIFALLIAFFLIATIMMIMTLTKTIWCRDKLPYWPNCILTCTFKGHFDIASWHSNGFDKKKNIILIII